MMLAVPHGSLGSGSHIVKMRPRMRRRSGSSAGFLVHAFFPWELVSGIGVINNAIADKVREAIAALAHQPEVKVQRNWYY